MKIEKKQIVDWLVLCAKVFAENEKFLTDLDSDLGDADHGININRGFKVVAEHMPILEKQSISTILKSTGVILYSSVGGASGLLYSTMFFRIALAIGSLEKLSIEQFIDAFKNGVDGIVTRGKAEIGDKTMCDVWLPVIDTAKNKFKKGDDLKSILNDMVEAAERGVLSTIEMHANKGQASHLGQQSIGHQDPGATSSMMMIKALAQTITQQQGNNRRTSA